MFNFIKNIGPVEWAVIILILVMVFGRKIVTGLGRAAGATFKEIKSVKKGITKTIEVDEPESDKKEEV
jgi:Sec-independent protein translocase protein TatA